MHCAGAARWTRQQRSQRSGRAVAALTVGRREDDAADTAELRPRAAYGVWSVVFLVVALYIAIGALLNYTRVGGYVSDIAWLLALALTLAAAFGFAAGVSSALWLRWHDPPRWLRVTAIRTRLAANTALDEPGVPGWRLSTAVLVTSVVAAMFALMVGASPHVVDGLDESISNWIRSRDIFDALRFVDPWGSIEVTLALAVVIGLAVLRCRTAALTVAGAIVTGLALHAWLQGVVERPRPDAEDILTHAFPSGHVLLAVALAGLLPLALVAITGRKHLGPPASALFIVIAGAGATHRVYEGTHWPSDVVGAALIGLAIALAAWWVIEHQRWHARCRRCVWAPAGHEPRRRGAVHIAAHRLPTIRRLAHLAGAAAALGLAVLTITVGVPANPEATVFGPAIATPVQLAFAAHCLRRGTPGVEVGRRRRRGDRVRRRGPRDLRGRRVRPDGRDRDDRRTADPGIPALDRVAAPSAPGPRSSGWPRSRPCCSARPRSERSRSTTTSSVRRTPRAPQSIFPSTGSSGRGPAACRAMRSRSWRSSTAAATRRPPRSCSPPTPALIFVSARSARTTTAWSVSMHPTCGRIRTTGSSSWSTASPTRRVGSDRSAPRVSARSPSGSRSRRAPGSAPTAASSTRSPRATRCCTSRWATSTTRTSAATSPDAFRSRVRPLLTEPARRRCTARCPSPTSGTTTTTARTTPTARHRLVRAARQAYREVVPHAGVAPGEAPINQAFTIGRVRFVLTDNRSERTDDSMLGDEQRAWLIDELTASSRTHAARRVGQPRSVDRRGSRGRRQLGRVRATNARSSPTRSRRRGSTTWSWSAATRTWWRIDDGTNSDYSTAGGGGVPRLPRGGARPSRQRQGRPLQRRGIPRSRPVRAARHRRRGRHDLGDDHRRQLGRRRARRAHLHLRRALTTSVRVRRSGTRRGRRRGGR